MAGQFGAESLVSLRRNTHFNSSSASSPTQVPECLRIARAEERRGTGLMPDLTLFRPDCFLGSKRSPNDFTLAVAPEE